LQVGSVRRRGTQITKSAICCHASITTTSRYLGSTPETRERAMQRFEKHHGGKASVSHTEVECAKTGEANTVSVGDDKTVQNQRVS
jgi:hypothetical protein